MRRDETRAVPRFDRLEERNHLSTIVGAITGTLVIGPLAGKRTPPGDFRIFGSGSVQPLGRVHASGITPSTSGEAPRYLIISDHRGFVRLAILSHGADALESSIPVQVRIKDRTLGLGARTGERGTGTLAEGFPTPGGTILFELTFDIP